MIKQPLSTIKDASRAYRTLQHHQEVSALLGEEYVDLKWSDTSSLAAARRTALQQGILPDPWGVQDFIEELTIAANNACHDIFQAAWR